MTMQRVEAVSISPIYWLPLGRPIPSRPAPARAARSALAAVSASMAAPPGHSPWSPVPATPPPRSTAAAAARSAATASPPAASVATARWRRCSRPSP